MANVNQYRLVSGAIPAGPVAGLDVEHPQRWCAQSGGPTMDVPDADRQSSPRQFPFRCLRIVVYALTATP
jgi:hypothetical protein